ncbi:MAG: isoleucine--tRNA ligase [Aigarchaeota archaeon]|nr:isoleucine--tRNA ligase [Aigarchaeota archaeon]MDW8093155.1 isoleucine--tRNA ligase [Nitrososphaerota archaeon]
MYALPPIYDWKSVEAWVTKFWAENDIVRLVMERNKGAPIFAFLEGPPTVNGYMHIGHARGRVYKDIVLRYQSMRGMDVWRRAGWDCQGLPTELEVEKRLGIKSKKDIEAIGMERFVQEANALVDHYIERWRADSERLGLWLDYETAYQTRDERYMEHVWYLLKRAYESNDLITSYRVVPFCPSCETPLSSHEVAQGYEETEDYSIYVKFKVLDGRGGPPRYLVIWTTTPWTIPGNEAVAVNPDETYAEVRVGEEVLIIAEKLVERVLGETAMKGHEILRRIRGKSLEGLRYEHPLREEVPIHESHAGPSHSVVTADFVALDEGTGLVHIAPGHGPEDFELGKKVGLPVLCPIDHSGRFTEEGGVFRDKYFRDVAPEVIERLRSKHLLLYEGKVTHTYPLCWRCGTHLIYIASKQWFLKVDRVKRIMIEENEKVKWYPRWAGVNRFGEWLQNAEDWCISRTKIWGTPLNVWRCETCGRVKVVGSADELQDAAVKPKIVRLHRPWIDQVVFKCMCGGEMRREPFVLDTWLDSGVAHIASVDYLRNRDLLERLHPYDYITEAIDQTRGWFYTLIFTSALLFNKSPYKTVLTQGHVLDKYGKKMSKSRSNVIWAADAFESFGVDNLRVYLTSKAAPWDAVNFDPDEIKVTESNLNVLWNAFSFIKTYFDLDHFNPARESLEYYLGEGEPEDRWLLSRVNLVIRKVTSSIERFDLHEAVREILRFVREDLSRTYIRAVRRRFWTEERTKNKLSAYATSYYVILRVLVMLSIFAPYVSEYLYQKLRTPDDPPSIHLMRWPHADEKMIDLELEDSMEAAEDVITASLNARQRAKRKLRWPVSRLVIAPSTKKVANHLRTLSSYIMRISNALSIEIKEPGQKLDELELTVEPVLPKLGPKFGKRLNSVVEALKAVKVNDLIQTLETQGKYEIQLPDSTLVEITSEDVKIAERLPDYIVEGEGRMSKVYLDLREDERIRGLSVANEVIRRIQTMRKDLNLEITKEVLCRLYMEPVELGDLVKDVVDYIEEETRTKLLIVNEVKRESGEYLKEWRVGDARIVIALSV